MMITRWFRQWGARRCARGLHHFTSSVPSDGGAWYQCGRCPYRRYVIECEDTSGNNI